MKRFITYGTFDMFHIGHLNLLKRIKSMAGELTVAVSTDDFNKQKGKATLMPYEQRAEIVRAIRYVDRVIPEHSWEQKVEDVARYQIDAFAIGDDWRGKFDFLKDHCEVIYLERTSDVSTSKLKKSLQGVHNISRKDLLQALDILEQLRRDLE